MFRERTTIRRLVGLFTRPRSEPRGVASDAMRASGDRRGCCPACQAFVRWGPADARGRPAACPGRGRPIRSLDAFRARGGMKARRPRRALAADTRTIVAASRNP